MIELIDNILHVSFPEVHPEAVCKLEFQRTLRIPDDGSEYPLPAGLGKFPLYPVEDHAVSSDWKKHGGIFLPMYQSEAMWLNFKSEYPFAVKVAAGKINAITGENWSNGLHAAPQDYLVLPDQPWIDGFCVSKGVVRQFVAASLGDGHTVEEQLTGDAEWGGIQLIFYPMKAEEYRYQIELPKQTSRELSEVQHKLYRVAQEAKIQARKIADIKIDQEKLQMVKQMAQRYPDNEDWQSALRVAFQIEEQQKQLQSFLTLLDSERRNYPEFPEFLRGMGEAISYCDMGMAAGGKIRQEIYEDPWDINVWDNSNTSRCFVHLLNSATFKEVTGKLPPTEPITPQEYANKGVPWFEYYSDKPSVVGSSRFANIRSLAASMFAKYEKLRGNDPIDIAKTVVLPPKGNTKISEGHHW